MADYYNKWANNEWAKGGKWGNAAEYIGGKYMNKWKEANAKWLSSSDKYAPDLNLPSLNSEVQNDWPEYVLSQREKSYKWFLDRIRYKNGGLKNCWNFSEQYVTLDCNIYLLPIDGGVNISNNLLTNIAFSLHKCLNFKQVITFENKIEGYAENKSLRRYDGKILTTRLSNGYPTKPVNVRNDFLPYDPDIRNYMLKVRETLGQDDKLELDRCSIVFLVQSTKLDENSFVFPNRTVGVLNYHSLLINNSNTFSHELCHMLGLSDRYHYYAEYEDMVVTAKFPEGIAMGEPLDIEGSGSSYVGGMTESGNLMSNALEYGLTTYQYNVMLNSKEEKQIKQQVFYLRPGIRAETGQIGLFNGTPAIRKKYGSEVTINFEDIGYFDPFSGKSISESDLVNLELGGFSTSALLEKLEEAVQSGDLAPNEVYILKDEYVSYGDGNELGRKLWNHFELVEYDFNGNKYFYQRYVNRRIMYEAVDPH